MSAPESTCAWYGAYRQCYPLGTLSPGTPLPDGLATAADDIPTLAARIDIDSDGLLDEVNRFNGFCENGLDEDYARGQISWSIVSFGDASRTPNPFLGPIITPPFFAIKLTQVGMGIPSVGVDVDAKGRVHPSRGAPITGLYAAGNAAGRSDVPGYQSGVANARGLALGYSAALQIARDVGGALSGAQTPSSTAGATPTIAADV